MDFGKIFQDCFLLNFQQIKVKKEAHLDTRKYSCEECDKRVIGSRAFFSHRRRHKKFQCPKCEKHLVIDYKARHTRNCTGVKIKGVRGVQQCHHEGCSYTTDRTNNIKRHLETHKMHCCDVAGCGLEFQTRKKLDAHKRKLHKPQQGPKKQPKKHSCGWCKYETRYTTNLVKHETACKVKRDVCPDIVVLCC